MAWSVFWGVSELPSAHYRSQKFAHLALKRVTQLFNDGSVDRDTKSRYQLLCQSFPVMVRQSGLIQALAFSAAKGKDETGLGRAHRRILGDVTEILGLGEEDPVRHVSSASALDYVRMTDEVLRAWVYFKRFSKSMLKLEAP